MNLLKRKITTFALQHLMTILGVIRASAANSFVSVCGITTLISQAVH